MSDARRHHLGLTLTLLVLTAIATVVGSAVATEDEGPGVTVVGDRVRGEDLFLRDCATCHGPLGAGTDNGPPITAEGTASIDFQMRSRRMPIASSDVEVERGVARRADGSPVRYSEQEMADIVAYADAWTTGPGVPDLPAVSGERALAHGGELWRRECAVCHQLAGRGGVLLDDTEVPSVLQSSALEIVEATRVGPFSMPAFDEASIDDEEAAALALYVEEALQGSGDPGGWGASRLGPFAEGAAAWVLGLVTLLLAAAWVGRRT